MMASVLDMISQAFLILVTVFATTPLLQAQQHEAKRLRDGRIVQPPELIGNPGATCPTGHSLVRRHKVVEIYVIIPETGVPEGIKVVRSAGKAFDDQAVLAVQNYRFHPATIENEPVKVDLYLDVNFKC